ncbi:PREDICTED: uncharacterized protein At4g08330, chloroplastic-like isoform X2 [Tarenaya hassleriana]|uniref:uncharacterized protein At4g08330, chloroplastic-like isoform X2 n=1 Tax=Tarenaya hassleriana TaxID=28532 RepID=UPI00053C7D3B|nr:PREDICTED: uncharacterized protein At4g08330, chloroplastic-like isoform X2 [Tarenaya hassleriana]
MSEASVSYSCGSCGYPLNLSSSDYTTSSKGKNKSGKKGSISFSSADLSRFTQVDEMNCFRIPWGRYGLKTKLLCRKCGVLIGYGYGVGPMLCGCHCRQRGHRS